MTFYIYVLIKVCSVEIVCAHILGKSYSLAYFNLSVSYFSFKGRFMVLIVIMLILYISFCLEYISSI